MPTLRPFQVLCMVRLTRPWSQASPSSSSVTATGLKAVAGLLWKKAKPLGQLVWNQVAQAHIVGQHHQTNALECLFGRTGAHGHITGDDGHLGFKVYAHSLRSGTTTSSQGPMKSSLPPWYINGSL